MIWWAAPPASSATATVNPEISSARRQPSSRARTATVATHGMYSVFTRA